MRDRAAAGADLDQLDGGDLHGQAGAAQEALLARRLEAVGDQRLAVVDQRELGRRAAHVEGEHALEAGVAAEPGAGQRARRRAAFQQLHRRALGLAHMGQAAVRQHQEQAAGNALGAQRLLQPLEIDLGQRPDIGVGHRRDWRAGIRGSPATTSDDSEIERFWKRSAIAAPMARSCAGLA